MEKYRRAVLIVSYGTSDQVSLEKTVEAAEKDVSEHFEGTKVYRAFSSDSVRKKLRRERGVRVDDVQEALERIKTDGYMQVYVQPVHMIEDSANECMREEVDARIACGCYAAAVTGRPLLDSDRDFEEAAAALAAALPDARREHGRALLITGCTGSLSEKQALDRLQKAFDRISPESFFTVGAKDDKMLKILADRFLQEDIQEILALPLAFSSGGSGLCADTLKDTAGPYLQSRGLRVRSVMKGMGECAGIRGLAIRHLEQILR